MPDQLLGMLRDQLVTIVSGTIFLFIGSASVCLAAARRQSQVRVFLWLGIWSGMYGARLLIESPAVAAALPPWIQIALPFLRIAFAYLLVPVVALAWLELSIDKMRLFLRVVILIGLAVAIVGVGFFVVTGSADRLILYTGQAFGDHKFEEVVQRNRSLTPSEFSDKLLAEIRRWQPPSVAQHDDITLIVIDVI